MKTNNQTLLKNEINQMNMNVVIKLVALSSSTEIMKQMKVLTERVSEHLQEIDKMFSPFRYDSQVSKFQRGDQTPLTSSNEFKEIYNSAVLSQQMTNGIYRPYFAGRFDPSEIVRNWAIEQVFNDELKPLLKNPEIVAVYLSGDDNAKFATKQGADFRWQIDITEPKNEADVITTYYLQNGAIATDKNNDKQTTVIRSSLIEAGIWALVGVEASVDEFMPFVAHYNLTGIAVGTNILNFNLGSIIDNKNLTVRR